MAQTRSQAARTARINAIITQYPNAISSFTEGVGSVLRQWTALELATHHQWGGPKSGTKADGLVTEIVDLFLGPDKIYKDDISLLLDDYMETNFSTICEDESTDDLGSLFCDMWRECTAGKLDLVSSVLSREFVRHEMVSKSEGMLGGDADDGSDDGEYNEEAEEEFKQAIRKGTEGELAPVMEGAMEEEEEEPEPPRVDPDGWETVARGKKVSKKR